jgi:hypothetical protein
MATLSITKNWADGDILLEADLDEIKTDVETFLNTTKINDDNIQTSGITASSKLIDASISTAKLADSAVTTAKITDLNVTAAKIAADAVTTAKILDANVTKAKLATAARDPTADAKSADFTAALTKDNYTVDSSSATVTMTLPAASTASGHEYTVTKTSASNTVVLDGNSSETINGATTLTLYEQYETVTIWCDGSAWYIRNRYIPGNTFQPVVVRAKMTGTQTISASTWTTIQFGSEDTDNKSAYNTGTYTFTVPTGCAGDYLITGSYDLGTAPSSFGISAGQPALIGYKVNSGSQVVMGACYKQVTSSTIVTVTGSDVTSLAAGDTVVVQIYHAGDGTLTIRSDSTVNHMAIARIR